MRKNHILLVEDDEDIQQLVSFNLIKTGFHVTCTDDGEQGLEAMKKETFDCIILDLMLPGKSGYEICKQVRNDVTGRDIPIIMLTAKGEDNDIISGLDHGADDYITKPFSPKVLIARIKSVLRRRTDADEKEKKAIQVLADIGLSIDINRHEVLLQGKEINLTMTEFSLLSLLASKPGRVFSRQQIIDKVKGYDYYVTPRAIDVQIFGLRKKLGQVGNTIETVRGIGYRFKE